MTRMRNVAIVLAGVIFAVLTAVVPASASANPYVMTCRAVYGGYSNGYHTIGARSTVATNAKVFRYRVKLAGTGVSKWHEYKNYSSRFLLPNKNRVMVVQAWQGGVPCTQWNRSNGSV